MHVPPVAAVVEHFVEGAEQTFPQHACPAAPQPEHFPGLHVPNVVPQAPADATQVPA